MAAGSLTSNSHPPLYGSSASTERTNGVGSPHRIATKGIRRREGYFCRIKPMAIESGTIGQRLRARRVELGLTLAEVAEKSRLSLPYVSNLERGRGNPTLEALGALARALDVPLASLVGDEGPVDPAQVVLASAPASLRQFSRSPDFQEAVGELAERQGESVEAMRQKLLVGMASSPQRSSGEPTNEDWRRILDAYWSILKKR
jgi:transcriptional regulator with XRE-family HTH domain